MKPLIHRPPANDNARHESQPPTPSRPGRASAAVDTEPRRLLPAQFDELIAHSRNTKP